MKKKIEFPEMSTNLDRIMLPSAVQAKYDGELVVWSGGCLTNRFGRERFDMPCTEGLPEDLEIMGELYWGSGRRNFYEAQSHLKQDDPRLKFAMFAFYNADMTYSEQLTLLRLINTTEQRHVVESTTAYSHLEVEYLHKRYMEQGFEGSVIKPLPSKTPYSWLKWKPDETIDLWVVGISKDKSAIAVGREDGTILGHCSVLGKEKETGLLIGHKPITGENKEDYLITPDTRVEVKHLGVIPQSGRLRNPRILRYREDK